ncbi:hypothetical protein ANN_06823 [Periplaneta americana]|uniref:Uncharacterized protein n=1 Tax=Periplaneta americana TaxID=6978 RepID=A0ABQ8TGI4_PERAM|nr:hypothetical protein ANN_06823 [Periplaneta americana]
MGRKVSAERRSEILCVSARSEMVRSEMKKKNDEFITEKGEVDVSGPEMAKDLRCQKLKLYSSTESTMQACGIYPFELQRVLNKLPQSDMTESPESQSTPALVGEEVLKVLQGGTSQSNEEISHPVSSEETRKREAKKTTKKIKQRGYQESSDSDEDRRHSTKDSSDEWVEEEDNNDNDNFDDPKSGDQLLKLNRPPLPQSIREIDIVEPYNKTLRGQSFMFFEPGRNDGRVLLFATNRNLELLAASDTIFSDGENINRLRHQRLQRRHVSHLRKISELGIQVGHTKSKMRTKKRSGNTYGHFQSTNHITADQKPQSLMLAGSEFQSLGRAIVKEDEYEEVRWDGIVSIVSWRERVFRLWWEESLSQPIASRDGVI